MKTRTILSVLGVGSISGVGVFYFDLMKEINRFFKLNKKKLQEDSLLNVILISRHGVNFLWIYFFR